MPMKMRQAASIAMPLVLVVLAGCGKSAYPVKGKITLEGKPLWGGGSITFLPLASQMEPASGMIAEDGTYQLSNGARPGDYRVVITQTTQKERAPTPDGTPAAPVLSVPPDELIPEIYADHRNSPLNAKVEPKGPNDINFNLKSE